MGIVPAEPLETVKGVAFENVGVLLNEGIPEEKAGEPVKVGLLVNEGVLEKTGDPLKEGAPPNVGSPDIVGLPVQVPPVIVGDVSSLYISVCEPLVPTMST